MRKSLLFIENVVVLVVPIFYLLWNISFTRGPSFASSDEGGYLSWARLILEKPSPIRSAVFPGYSLVISPLYLTFTDPYSVWIGVLTLNFAMSIATLRLALNIIRKHLPADSWSLRLTSVIVVSSFPMFGTMMNYAFPSILGALLVAVAFNAIEGLFTGRFKPSIIFALATGFLLSVHPTFGPLWIASVGVIILYSKTHINRVTGLLLQGLLPFLVLNVLRPRLYSFDQFNGDTSGYSSFWVASKNFANIWRYQSALIEASTLGFSTIVASMGLIGFMGVELYRSTLRKSTTRDSWSICVMWLFISIAGAFAMTVYAFGRGDLSQFYNNRFENFIFLRYLEPFIVPVMLIGLISFSKTTRTRTKFLVVVVQLAITLSGGSLLSAILRKKLESEGALSQTDFLKPFANSFWVSSLSTNLNPHFWIMAACLGILMLLGPRLLFCAFSVILTFGFTLPAQRNHYLWFFEKYASPSKLADVIRREIPEGQCVAWDSQPAPVSLGASESSDGIQFGNVAFQLGAYDLRPISQESWRNSCSGPLLTFNPDPTRDRIVLRDSIRNLYLVTHTQDSNSFAAEDEFELIGNKETSELCVFRDCFGRDFKVLSQYSEVGKLSDNALISTSRSGVLFRTPGNALDRGSYQIRVFGNFEDLSGVSLLANWNDGVNQSILSTDRCETGLCSSLTLNEWVSDLKLVLRVSQASRIEVRGLTVTH